ncbi:hypothetical protein MC885_001663 [Smutsia gigantea]|nr:hypothetical protein MC885_001663 [Smutsia gigantea]
MEAPMLASAMCWALCWASDYTAWPLPLSPGGGAREQPVCRGESGPHRGCPGRHSHLALPTPKPEPGTTMEHNRALGHQELHWKEFRFDLTQIPAGEEVTAAEFRIYKLPSTHLLNRTLHISMFEVVREQSNRCLLLTLPLVRPPSTLQAEDEGWLVLDVTAASDHWSLNPNKDLGLRLYVETEDGKAQGSGREPSPGLLRGCWQQAQLEPPSGLAFVTWGGVMIPSPPRWPVGEGHKIP